MQRRRFLSMCLCGAAVSAATPARALRICRAMWMPPLDFRTVSRGFGITPEGVMHNGIDLVAPLGSPVRTAGAGVVTHAGPHGDYGNLVEIHHPEGFATRYAHLSAIEPELRSGWRIDTLAEVGRIGVTGLAHGAHLHFEVRIGGVPVDPRPWLGMANCPVGPPPAPPAGLLRDLAD